MSLILRAQDWNDGILLAGCVVRAERKNGAVKLGIAAPEVVKVTRLRHLGDPQAAASLPWLFQLQRRYLIGEGVLDIRQGGEVVATSDGPAVYVNAGRPLSELRDLAQMVESGLPGLYRVIDAVTGAVVHPAPEASS